MDLSASPSLLSHLSRFWSLNVAEANMLIVMHLVGALLLGMLVGYERRFRGRAAGMRTYGLVCMTSAGLTVVTGMPDHWFGGNSPFHGETSHVMQGIVTGIGFLGAGVIMRDGFHVTGLSTAASIWTSSAIGVLVGAGFYGAAILMSVVCALSMEWGRRLEQSLPAHTAMAVTLGFEAGRPPLSQEIERWMTEHGYALEPDTLVIRSQGELTEWHFNASALGLNPQPSPARLAEALRRLPGLSNFSVSPYKS